MFTRNIGSILSNIIYLNNYIINNSLNHLEGDIYVLLKSKILTIDNLFQNVFSRKLDKILKLGN